LQVGEVKQANVVVDLIREVLVAPVPAIAGHLHGQLGGAAVVHLDQHASGRNSHADQNQEGHHGPENFQPHVLVESRRLRTLGATVGNGGVHDQTEHQQTNQAADD